jgi:hypothetical protein
MNAVIKAAKARTLQEIADELQKIDRTSLFETGELLLEAKAANPGEFLAWLDDELEISEDTAERYMAVARIGQRFRKLRNLKLGKTTLYALRRFEEDEERLASVINALGRQATKRRLKPAEAERLMDIGEARHDYGDYPDATLYALASGYLSDEEERALKDAKPETDEAVEAILEPIRERQAAEREANREAEIEGEIEGEDDSSEEEEEEAKPLKPEGRYRPPPNPMPGEIGPMFDPGAQGTELPAPEALKVEPPDTIVAKMVESDRALASELRDVLRRATVWFGPKRMLCLDCVLKALDANIGDEVASEDGGLDLPHCSPARASGSVSSVA